jgi:hypothetical protein
VTGHFNGKISSGKYEFIWKVRDENEEAHGRGWLQKQENMDIIEGEFLFYEGDNSKFTAKRYK